MQCSKKKGCVNKIIEISGKTDCEDYYKEKLTEYCEIDNNNALIIYLNKLPCQTNNIIDINNLSAY